MADGSDLLRGDEAAPCRALKHKMLYIVGVEPDPVASSIGGQYWCVHTQGPIGPDDQPVLPERCRAGRGCHERGG